MADLLPILEERTARYTTVSLYQTLLIALLIAPQAALFADDSAKLAAILAPVGEHGGVAEKA